MLNTDDLSKQAYKPGQALPTDTAIVQPTPSGNTDGQSYSWTVLPWLQLNRQVWLQAVGRGLYQAGVVGVVQFHAPIIFVNHFGLPAASVGLGVASSSITGIIGNVLGGILTDSDQCGRKGTLVIGAGLAMLSCALLVTAQDLLLFIAANLLVGLGLGLYWTSADAAIMDVTTPEDRHHGFAVSVTAESVGVATGILGGGVLLSHTDNVQLLFVSGTLIFFLLLGLILGLVVETRQGQERSGDKATSGWTTALKDRRLITFVAVNSLFVTYLALVNVTMPLYFTNFLSFNSANEVAEASASSAQIGSLFALCYVGLGAIFQLPVVSVLGSLGWAWSLMLSMGMWGCGFFLVWCIGGLSDVSILYKVGVLGVLGVATAIYRPFAATFLADIAPESLRGIYTSIGYQCWAIGYIAGPLFGGWALDQSSTVARYAWMAVGLSSILGLAVLWILAHQKPRVCESP